MMTIKAFDSIPSPAVRDHGCADVDPASAVAVGVRRGVAAQPGAAAAAVCHQEEAADGGNVPAQRRGEEADGRSRVGKTWPASAAAQRRTAHMMQCAEKGRSLPSVTAAAR